MRYYLIKDNYEASNVVMHPIPAGKFSALAFPILTSGVMNYLGESGAQILFGFKGGSGVQMTFSNDPSIIIFQPPPDKQLK